MRKILLTSSGFENKRIMEVFQSLVKSPIYTDCRQ